MALISLIIKGFLLFFVFNILLGAFRFFRVFKQIKKQSHSQNFQNTGEHSFKQQGGAAPSGSDVFEAEYKVVRENSAE